MGESGNKERKTKSMQCRVWSSTYKEGRERGLGQSVKEMVGLRGGGFNVFIKGWGLDSCGQKRDGDKGGRARKEKEETE